MSPRQEFTKRTKYLAFQTQGGSCRKCTARLMPGKTEYHHDTECTFGGNATLQNCVVLCTGCHAEITGQRAAVIAKSNRTRDKHLGIRRRSSFSTNRDGAFKKKMSGEVIRR